MSFFRLILHIFTLIQITCPIKDNLHLLKPYVCTNQISSVRSELKIKCQSHLSKKSHETQIELICNAALRNMNGLNEDQPLSTPSDFQLTITSNLKHKFYLVVLLIRAFIWFSTSIEATILKLSANIEIKTFQSTGRCIGLR